MKRHAGFRHAGFLPNRIAALATGLLAALAGGCMPTPEQLSLPSPFSPSPTETTRPGADLLSASADKPDRDRREPRVIVGSGQFMAAAPAGPAQRAGKGGAAGKGPDENGITLKVIGASVAEVAKTVLGDTLKVNYTVSDKVKATITFNTVQPIPRDDLLKVFESILRSEGAAIVVENDVYRIVPADAATAAGVPARWNSSHGARQAGVSTEAAPLRYVSAAAMERVLKSVAPQVTISRVDNARNLLLVTGTPNELAATRETVSAFDVDWMQGMSFGLLPVESADPETIAQELDKVFGADADGPAKGVVRFVPNGRLKAVLVISSRPEYLRKAEGWVRRLDLAGQATEPRVNVYHVQNRPAAELATLLQKVYASQSNARNGGGVAAAAQQGVVRMSSGDEGLGGGAGGLQGLAPPPPPGGANGGQTANGAAPEPFFSGSNGPALNDRAGGVSIVADDPNNALVITATPSEYKRIRQILARIDVAPNQLLLEATIAEVTLNDNLQFGLKWYFKAGNSRFTLTDGADDAIVPLIAPGFPGFSHFFNLPNVQVALDALSKVTDVNVVSSPSLMVLDNKKAVLQIGDEVPISTQSAANVTTANPAIVNSIAYRNTGVILAITPRVSDNGRVLLDIEQEVSDVVPTTSSRLDSPTIQQRRIKTSVAVSNGESVVLAGLMQDSSSLTKKKAPLVGDIPLVGNLFKQKDDDIHRTELLIAITPHVVKDQMRMRDVADEFKDRLNFRTRPQRKGPPDTSENVDRVFR